MSKNIQAVRGMNDIPPAETPYWRMVEDISRSVLGAYGYNEIRMPVVEKTELFVRSIGEVTDIVEKEMYTFADRNGESLTLRPEATASMVRAGIQLGLLHNQVQRLWCIGPMFRHERPQKGRYRQFHQLDVEAFGLTGPEVDAELILLMERMWQQFGLTDMKLEINSLGTREIQAKYRGLLIDYFTGHQATLDADSQRRLHRNPLRILDSKNPDMQALVEDAPRLIDHLDEESETHFDKLKEILTRCDIGFDVNSRLVRGLDYYTRTVFEWVTDELGAQSAVCGGGRYDGLVEEIGGRSVPAIGFALGLERLVELLKTHDVQPARETPQVYLVAVGEQAGIAAHPLAEKLRSGNPGLRIMVDAGPGNFGRKLKNADRSGASTALILGENEISENCVSVKHLRDSTGQLSVAQADLLTNPEKYLTSPMVKS